MKHLVIFILLILLASTASAQDTIRAEFDIKKKRLTHKPNFGQWWGGLNYGKSYILEVDGINTSFLSTKLEPKSYHIASDVPEILKPLFIGITSDYMPFDDGSELTQLDSVNIIAMQGYNNLRKLKAEADTIYKMASEYPAQTLKYDTLATKALIELYRRFTGSAIDTLRKESRDILRHRVNQAIWFPVAAAERYGALIEHSASVDYRFLTSYADLKLINENIKADNYLRYLNFLEASLDAKTSITAKPFVAEKDLVEVNALVVNTYKGDTIHNAPLRLYTRSNVSFDFTTGFFVNNVVERSYYLGDASYMENEDKEIKRVLEEDKSDYDLAIGALGHITYRFTSYLKFGPSVGAALSPLDGKTRYLLGLSLVLFREKQLAANFGRAYAKVKELSGSVQYDGATAYVPAAVTAVPTYDKFSRGWYFGVSYNLTAKKK